MFHGDLTSDGPWEATRGQGNPGVCRWSTGAPAFGGHRRAPRVPVKVRRAEAGWQTRGLPAEGAARHRASLLCPRAREPTRLIITYLLWQVGGGEGLGARPQLNGPEVHPRSCPHSPGDTGQGLGGGCATAGEACTTRRLPPGCPSPDRSAHTTRAASRGCPRTPPCAFSTTSRRLLPRPGTDPTVPTPPADHTGRASATSFPSWKARNLASAAHASFRRRQSHEPAECPSGKRVYSPRPQRDPFPF